MPIQSRPRIRLAIILIGIFVFWAFCLGIYHTTHGGGWRSGTIELFLAVLFGTLAYLVYRTGFKKYSPAGFKRSRVTLLSVIGPVALFLLIISFYHFTHQGLRSGIIELCLAIILSTIGFLLR